MNIILVISEALILLEKQNCKLGVLKSHNIKIRDCHFVNRSTNIFWRVLVVFHFKATHYTRLRTFAFLTQNSET